MFTGAPALPALLPRVGPSGEQQGLWAPGLSRSCLLRPEIATITPASSLDQLPQLLPLATLLLFLNPEHVTFIPAQLPTFVPAVWIPWPPVFPTSPALTAAKFQPAHPVLDWVAMLWAMLGCPASPAPYLAFSALELLCKSRLSHSCMLFL